MSGRKALLRAYKERKVEAGVYDHRLPSREAETAKAHRG